MNEFTDNFYSGATCPWGVNDADAYYNEGFNKVQDGGGGFDQARGVAFTWVPRVASWAIAHNTIGQKVVYHYVDGWRSVECPPELAHVE